MKTEILEIREEEGILTLLMNRPEKRNALSGELVEALAGALEEAGRREEVRVILLRGSGPDFCAGADLEELGRTLDQSPEASLEDARRLGDLLLSMRRHPKPIVAVVQGRALAGGCGLATACDLVLAREDAELGYPEVHIGFVPAMVMAFEMVAMGERIPAGEAYRMGLVNRVLPTDDFESRVRAFAADLAKRPASAVTLTKRLLYQQGDLTVAEGVERGAQVNVEARQTEACRSGIRAFLARKRGGSP